MLDSQVIGTAGVEEAVNVSVLSTAAAVMVELFSTVRFEESLTVKSLTLIAFTLMVTRALHTSGLETEHAFTYTVASMLLIPVTVVFRLPVRVNTATVDESTALPSLSVNVHATSCKASFGSMAAVKSVFHPLVESNVAEVGLTVTPVALLVLSVTFQLLVAAPSFTC